MSSDATDPTTTPAPNGAAVLAVLAGRVGNGNGHELREALAWVRGLPAHADDHGDDVTPDDAGDGSTPAP